MKALLISALTAGALSVGLLATTANAQQLRFGFGPGYGYNNGYGYGNGCGYYGDCYDNGYGYYGDGYGYGYRRHRHHGHFQHCYMIKTWHHHHAVWVRQCRW